MGTVRKLRNVTGSIVGETPNRVILSEAKNLALRESDSLCLSSLLPLFYKCHSLYTPS